MNTLTTDSNGTIETSPTRPAISNKAPETTRAAKLRAAARGETSSANTFALASGPDFDLAILAPAPSEGAPDNLLLAAAVGKAMDVKITFSSDLEYKVQTGDDLVLCVDTQDWNAGYEVLKLDENVHVPGTTVTVQLPAVALADGPHQLYYCIIDAFGSGPTSGPTSFVVDTAKPGGLFGLTSPDFGVLESILQKEGVTETLLDAQKGILKARINSYLGMALDDKLVPYVDDIPGDEFFVPAPTKNLSVFFNFSYTKAQIVSALDGVKKFTYVITDRAGNKSDPSEVKEFEALLAGAITDLVAPEVDAMVSDGVIAEAEARAGVVVRIPAHTRVVTGLWIVVTWGTKELARAPVLADNTAQEITVSALDVFAQGTGSYTVSYEIFKEGTSGASLLLGASPTTPVVVNLNVPGNPDPDPTTPWNENLGLPTVIGASGTPNVLIEADATSNAIVTIPWLTNTTPAVRAWEVGDLITVYWAGTPPEGSPVGTPITASKQVNAGDLAAGKDMELTVLPSEHQAVGGDIIVTYRAARYVTGSTTLLNYAASPNQTVKVESPAELPGGPGGLPQLEWPEKVPSRNDPDKYALIKKYSYDGVVIEIPHYINKKTNDQISYTFIAQNGGYMGGADGSPIPSTEIIDTYPVPNTEVGTSSFITLPNTGFFRDTSTSIEKAIGFQGSCKFDYEVIPEATKVPTPAPVSVMNIDTRFL